MSKPVRLSTSLIARTKAKERVVWLSDNDGTRGIGRLLLRISPSGSRRFYYRHTLNGVRSIIPLGPYAKNRTEGALTLEQGRAMGRRYAALHLPIGLSIQSTHSAATLPTRADISRRIESPERSLLRLCSAYVDGLKAANKPSASDFESMLRVYVAPSGVATLDAATLDDPSPVTDLLSSIVLSGKLRTAHKVRSLLHAAYAAALRSRTDASVPTALRDFGVKHNPIKEITLPEYDGVRDRSLDQLELAKFWRYLMKKTPVTSQIRAIRLDVLLGGQRCRQLLRARVEEVDMVKNTLVLWDKKGNRSKPRKHLLPLLAMAKAEVAELLDHSRQTGSPFLFAARIHGKTLSHYTVTRLVSEISDELSTTENVPHFTYGDIRRTIESHMQSLHIADAVRDHIQSHGLSGVRQKHYSRYRYEDEKREALEQWVSYLNRLLLRLERGDLKDQSAH